MKEEVVLIRCHRFLILASVVLVVLSAALSAAAYPPGVGILAKNRSCASCHVSNGPWGDESRTVIDVLDARTKQSLRGLDSVITIAVARGASRTVLTVIGRAAGEKSPPRDTELELHVMLTAGEAVKGKGQEGLISNLFVRKVRLKVSEP